MARVLVTGATGFIGRGLLPVLLTRGWTVRAALHRRSAAGAGFPAAVETVAVGPVQGTTDWRVALDQVDAVVHLAALAHENHSPAALQAVNVVGTLALARAMMAAGRGRLVFISSVKAGIVTEDSRDLATAYGQAKRRAEEALAGVPGLDRVVLRPHLVYGPGVGGNFARLLRWVAAGWPLPLGGIRNRRGLLFRDNLADAIAHALVHPAARGRCYTLHDGTPLATPELIRALAAALDCPARLWSLPPALLAGAATVLGQRAAWSRLAESLCVEDPALHRELGWTPPVTTADGLRQTAAWFRHSAAMSRHGVAV